MNCSPSQGRIYHLLCRSSLRRLLHRRMQRQCHIRILCALLTGGALDWVRAEGQILSVLVDGINEKLYGDFSDTVIEGEPPAVVEDYREELAGRYSHGIE